MDPASRRLDHLSPLQRAVLALKETQARLDALEARQKAPLAVIGMSCRFPGGVHDPSSYWELLDQARDAITPIPPERWDVDRFYDPDPAAPGKMNCRDGGFIEGIDAFDNHFFGISDREATRMDPQHRHLMELTWEALEDAGIAPSSLKGTRTGVFVGISLSDYGLMLSTDVSQTDAFVAAGTSLCMAANRLSFAFGLCGPSMSLDTACSSSLVAIHLACQSLRRGECDLALVAGSSALLSPVASINLTKAGFSARDGRVRAFDAGADGYVRGEGAGVVVLRRLEAARAAGDRIRAVIRGSATNQNGPGYGLVAPCRGAQEQVLREAYAQAGVDPASVGFVEAQGTGTRLGDAVELQALAQVLGEGRPAGMKCAIGSVKTNLGHLEAASGMAGFQKAVLCLERKAIPASLHFTRPNPDVPFDRIPFVVPVVTQPWTGTPTPRRAGVSAFGFGGTNAHVVLEEAADPGGAEGDGGTTLFLISARTESALRELCEHHVRFLRETTARWEDLCGTAASCRDHHDCRIAVRAKTSTEAASTLRSFLDGESPPAVFAGRKPPGRGARVAFLFGDNLSEWTVSFVRWLRSLTGMEALVRQTLGEPFPGRSLDLDTLLGARPDIDLDPAALHGLRQLVLAAVLRALGVVPEMVAGEGEGELTAASAAGLLRPGERLALLPGRGGDLPADLTGRKAALPLASGITGELMRSGPRDPAAWLAAASRSGGWRSSLELLSRQELDLWIVLGTAGEPAVPSRSTAPTRVLPALDSCGDAEPLLAALYATGIDMDWRALARPGFRRESLPHYPWQRRSHWAIPRDWLDRASKARAVSEPGSPVDRKSGSAAPRPDLTVPYVAPRDPREEELARAWALVLGLDRVGIHDDFFELGGDSLRATILLHRLNQATGTSLTVRDMYEASTISGLVRRITSAVDPAGPGRGVIPRVAREGSPVASMTQEALWFLDQMEWDRPAYTVYPTFRIRGPLDVGILERAFEEIARRHEVLRTRYPGVDGRPVPIVEPPVHRSLPVIDVTDRSPEERSRALEEWIAAETSRRIDLANGPVIRVSLIRLDPQEHVLMAAAHHIAFDGWSLGVMSRELTALYTAFQAGRPSPLPELSIQFADFAAWQRERLRGDGIQKSMTYWTKQLQDLPAIDLPTDLARPAARTTGGDTLFFDISPGLSSAIQACARTERVTTFMVLLAAFEVLLSRHSGQEDFGVGIPLANRPAPETESLIGCFINMGVLRADLGGRPSFRELLARVRETALAAYEHQEVTLDRVVDALRPARDPSRHPLFQVMFVFQNNEVPDLAIPGLVVEPLDDLSNGRVAFFELSLGISERAGSFRAGFNYNTDLFERATVERWAAQYLAVLEGGVRDPDCLVESLPPFDGDGEARAAWDPVVPRVGLVHHRFEQRVQEGPAAIAVVDGDRSWTYEELDRFASRIAREVAGTAREGRPRVAVRMPRRAEWVAAVLGVLKAGAIYLPLDPALPAAQLSWLLEEAAVDLLLTLGEDAGELAGRIPRILDVGRIPETGAPVRPGPGSQDPGPTDLAYVLYTSGSTGRPKGVMIEHRSLSAYAGAATAEYRLGAGDRVLQFCSPSYDGHIEELFTSLTCGATLVLRPEDALDARRLLEFCGEKGVTFITVPTAYWHELTAAIQREKLTVPSSVRTMVIGGESAIPCRVSGWFEAVGSRVRLLNTYGPTETTVVATVAELGPEDGRRARVPIGFPLGSVTLRVLDPERRPVPGGARGELYIGGPGVGRGYLGRPDLTASRFLEDPCRPGERLYRTGDVVRTLPGGRLEFCGRIDDQIKIRGHRLEPSEIERVLLDVPSVTQAVVLPVVGEAGDMRLAAYLSFTPGGPELTDAALRGYLEARLPSPMIPSSFVRIEGMPVTVGGKIDRARLPPPSAFRSPCRGAPPLTPVEIALSKIWCAVLGVPEVGREDRFFDLGGDSLRVLRLASRVRGAFAVDLPLVTFFTAPSLGRMAEIIEEARDPRPVAAGAAARPEVSRSPVRDPGSLVVPLREVGASPPLYLVHGLGGHVLPFGPLVRELPPDRPVHAIRSLGLEAGEDPQESLEAMAGTYADQVRTFHRGGPLLLGGWSLGGLIALEMARLLQRSGSDVTRVVLIDTWAGPFDLPFAVPRSRIALRIAAQLLGIEDSEVEALDPEARWALIARRAGLDESLGPAEVHRLARVCEAHLVAAAAYRPRPYAGPVTLFRAGAATPAREPLGELCPHLVIESVPGTHVTLLREPHVRELAARLGAHPRSGIAPGVPAPSPGPAM